MAYESLNEMQYADGILQTLAKEALPYPDLEDVTLSRYGRKTERARSIFRSEVSALRKMGLVCIDSVVRSGLPLRLTPIGRHLSVQNSRTVTS